MASEWKNYTDKLLRIARSGYLAIGVSLIFFLAALPETKPEDRWLILGISLTHGAAVFAWIFMVYAAAYAVVIQIQIRTGRMLVLNWPMSLTLSFVGTAAGLVTAKLLIALALNRPFNSSSVWETLVIGGFISLMFQFYYAYKHSMQENEKLKSARVAAELHVLKNQMQPHFLFNSLNSLAELIESNPSYASTMTQVLADLYREILENSKIQVAPISSEIAIVKKYLELEKLRFGDRLKYTLRSLEKEEGIYIPTLVLQTLVENAVKHGISQSVAGGEIQVNIFKSGDAYKAEILNSNSFLKVTERQGVGIENTKSRLDLLYGKQHQFEFKLQDNTALASFWFSGEKVGN